MLFHELPEIKREEEWSADFDHIIIIVAMDDGQYLVDVGFGDLFIQPIKIVEHIPQVDYTRYFRFDKDPDDRWVLKLSKDNSLYQPKYRFILEEKGFIQFLARCNYHQESPNSPFTQSKLITQLFPNGRITLTTRKLKLSLNGEVKEFELTNEEAFMANLENHFGIDSKKLILQNFE
ncbi:MAG: arylamine N-acetyltransferase [Cyclobacteriaceae bacterium]